MIKPAKMKRCAVCKDEFMPRSTLQKACGILCAVTIVKTAKAQAFDKETRAMKKKVSDNDVGLWAKKAQAMFNAYIRQRDVDLGCISCNKPASWQGQWAAGHYRTVGAHPELRFNEDNVHKQCNRDCNSAKSGNVLEYRIRLIKKIGIDRVEFLEGPQESVRYRIEDYKRIYAEFKAKTKQLKISKGIA